MERLHMTGGPKGKHGQERESYPWREALAQRRSPSRYVRDLRIFPGTRASNYSMAPCLCQGQAGFGAAMRPRRICVASAERAYLPHRRRNVTCEKEHL
jgi:hypothetical protein